MLSVFPNSINGFINGGVMSEPFYLMGFGAGLVVTTGCIRSLLSRRERSRAELFEGMFKTVAVESD